MIHQAFLSLTLALLAPAQTSAQVAAHALPTCCSIVQEVVYVHPKPAFPKDIRQYPYVKKTVEKVVCKADGHAACCAAKASVGQ